MQERNPEDLTTAQIRTRINRLHAFFDDGPVSPEPDHGRYHEAADELEDLYVELGRRRRKKDDAPYYGDFHTPVEYLHKRRSA